MTANPLLPAITRLVADLSLELPQSERYRRLLETLRELFPCDAAGLLRLEQETLIPLAVDGLSADTLGRRFRLAEHPRLSAITSAGRPVRFAHDSELPDPYDGLVIGLAEHLPIHDCLGVPLQIDGRLWGVLTLDSLEPDAFRALDMEALRAFATLVCATVKAAALIDALESRAEHARQAYLDLREATATAAPQELIGESAAMRRLRDEIGVVADTELTVLITGETGVGKELVAQAIHRQSLRSQQPLVELNCAAIPENLIESELFGHLKGAFSGAVTERRGKFDLADGGSLFLDEVGELPLNAQAKLLRALHGGEIQRVGSDRVHRVDVRIIAATNRDLQQEVRNGRFRADLYHRLSVFPLWVPPLRERERDALLLAGYFLEQNRGRLGVRALRLAADCQAALLNCDWPGNVRELEHLISRAALRARAEAEPDARIVTLHLHHLGMLNPPAVERPHTRSEPGITQIVSLRQAVDDCQRDLLRQRLALHRGNWAKTARSLGVDRGNLIRLAQRLGLRN